MQDTRSALDEVEEHEPIQSVDENTLGESPKNTTRQPVVERLMTAHPALKYLGFSLLMAYHYLMWFCPSSFFKTDLLAASVTVAWLWNLAGTAFFMIVTVVFLGRKRHLSDYPWVMRIVTVLLIVATALLLYGAPITSSTYVIYIFSFVAGGLEGLMWILWGESLTRARANFSVVHIGTTFGATVLVVMVVSLFIPADFSPLFVILLAALSGVFLYAHKKIPTTYPVLLPRDTVKPAFSSVLAVCSVGCFTGVACYYLVAIVPWEHFSVGEYIFVIGVVTGALLILLVSGLSVLFKAKASMFKLFPYYLVFAIVGLTLFQSHESLYPLAFVVGLSVSSLLEVSLIMYFGTLMLAVSSPRHWRSHSRSLRSASALRWGIAWGFSTSVTLISRSLRSCPPRSSSPASWRSCWCRSESWSRASSRSPQHPLLLRRSIRSVPRSSQSSSSQSAKARS